MSIKVQSHVWEYSGAKGSVLLTLLAIADYAHDDGTKAFPSIETLANKTRMSPRQVQYNIRALEEIGEITVHPNQGKSGVNVYQVMMGGMQRLHPANSAGVQDPTERGATHCTGGVQPIAPNPSVNPQVIHQIDIEISENEKPAKSSPAEFEVFWKSYPSGNGNKKKTLEHWKKLKPDEATMASILAGLEKWKRSKRWREGYIKAAEIWIRDRWWEDEPPMDPADVVAANMTPPAALVKPTGPRVEGEGNPLEAIRKAKEERMRNERS